MPRGVVFVDEAAEAISTLDVVWARSGRDWKRLAASGHAG
jgi:hypothetical protein